MSVTVARLLVQIPQFTEFSNIEPWMLKKAILALQSEGKAEYIQGTNPDDSDAGVKFFA